MGNELLRLIEQIVNNSPLLAYLAVFLGGIVFGLAPCALTVIPLTIGFVGGYAGGDKKKAFAYSFCFVLGLVITLMTLGIVASLMGKLFGQLGKWLYFVIAGVAIAMGLNILGVIELDLTFGGKINAKHQGPLGAFMLGLLFGVISTPCSTPLLIIILALVAAKGKILYGATLLLTYGLGQSMLVLAAGTFTGLVESLASSKGVASFSKNLKLVSGVLVILVGIFIIITHV